MIRKGMQGKYTSEASTIQLAMEECRTAVRAFMGDGATVAIDQVRSVPRRFMKTLDGCVIACGWETEFEWSVVSEP